MEHLTQDDLVLYRYQESPDAAAVARHLEACRQCRDEYAALERVLGLVETGLVTPHVPEPAASYERQVWMQVERRIADERASRRWWMFWRAEGSIFGLGHYGLVPQMALAATIALLLAGSFAIDFAVRPSSGTTERASASPSRGTGGTGGTGSAPAAAAAEEGSARGRVLYAAVGEHLQRSELMLVEFNNVDSEGPIDLTPQQEWAEDLVSENRLYRQSAAEAGEAQMVSVLDDLERVLLEVAHGPATANGEQLQRFRSSLDTQDLLFKVRVAGAGLRAREDMAVVLDSPFGHTGSGL